ncbi:aldo/keto reductase [Leadbetterella byssophila]|uniref:aldo/keto reductase n=1 Tax=Leadbetterella byssophila TaxID=316068 RepID=UPI00399F4651
MKFNTFRKDAWAEMGLGTWQLGSADWGNLDEAKALDILDAYVQGGGNFIDTADVYGLGTSERVIGKYLRQSGKPLFVATKLGRRQDGTNGWPQNFSYEKMKEHVESSLENLGIDSLYLEQLHCIPKEELIKGEVFEHLRRLKQEGLIQNFGVSVESIEEAEICLQHADVSSLQIIFNLFRQDASYALLGKAKAQGVGIIARVPLASGLLSGKFDANTTFDSTDHRNYNADGNAFNVGETFSGLPFLAGIECVKEISGILPKGNLAAWSLKWILQQEGITTVIPGASRISQVESNLSASKLPDLSPEILVELDRFYREKVRPQVRGEI